MNTMGIMFLYCENRKWFGGLTTLTGGFNTSVYRWATVAQDCWKIPLNLQLHKDLVTWTTTCNHVHVHVHIV